MIINFSTNFFKQRNNTLDNIMIRKSDNTFKIL